MGEIRYQAFTGNTTTFLKSNLALIIGFVFKKKAPFYGAFLNYKNMKKVTLPTILMYYYYRLLIYF